MNKKIKETRIHHELQEPQPKKRKNAKASIVKTTQISINSPLHSLKEKHNCQTLLREEDIRTNLKNLKKEAKLKNKTPKPIQDKSFLSKVKDWICRIKKHRKFHGLKDLAVKDQQ